MKKSVKCKFCDGTGYPKSGGYGTGNICPRCNGTGNLPNVGLRTPDVPLPKCYYCDDTGVCSNCGGKDLQATNKRYREALEFISDRGLENHSNTVLVDIARTALKEGDGK